MLQILTGIAWYVKCHVAQLKEMLAKGNRKQAQKSYLNVHFQGSRTLAFWSQPVLEVILLLGIQLVTHKIREVFLPPMYVYIQ